MPKPLLSADAIFDEALRVLADEGAAGLTIRNLAGRLRCSNKTLYQQVGTHDVMVRGVVARAFAQLELGLCTDCAWQEAAESWCVSLREALFDHPDLCTLMSTDDRGVIFDSADQLVAVLERGGFSPDRALQAAGILTHVTVSMTLSDVAAPGLWDDPSVFATTVGWLIEGMTQMHSQTSTQLNRHIGRAVVGRRCQPPQNRSAS